MVVIPRTRHAHEGVFLNAMGYAGSFLVRSAEQLERLRAIGPRRVLAEAGRRT
jgi:ATP adenylyltransferase